MVSTLPQKGHCSGGHGLSIGSVGGRKSNTVKDVTISNTQVVNSQNGAHQDRLPGGRVSLGCDP